MEHFVLANIAQFTYTAIFAFLMLTVFGFPFPEDAVLLLSGVAASQGITRVMPTMYIAYVGVVAGDLILYYIGRRYGRRLVNHRRFGRFLTRQRLRAAKMWFRRWGDLLVFFGRHLVGVRAQIFLCAGIFKHSARKVFLYDSLSAVLGVPVMVGLGYLFGHNLSVIRDKISSGRFVLTAAAFAAASLWLVYYIYKRRKAAKGV